MARVEPRRRRGDTPTESVGVPDPTVSARAATVRAPVEQAAAADDALVGKLMALILDIRADARKKKDFALSDKVRDALAAAGIQLEDRKGEGTVWTRKR